MTKATLSQLLLSVAAASAAHVGLYAAMTEATSAPDVLIQGQSISVQLTTAGNAAHNSAASNQQEEKVAGQADAGTLHEKSLPPKPRQKTQPPTVPESEPEVTETAPAETPETPGLHMLADTQVVPEASSRADAQRPTPTDIVASEKRDAEAPSTDAPEPSVTEEVSAPPESVPPDPVADMQQEEALSQDHRATDDPATKTESITQGKGADVEDIEASVASAAKVAGSAAAKTGEKSATPGNAAASNFAGLVMQHLSRFRRPRASGPGSAFVTFTFTDGGEIASIEISKSSGSRKFDRDAVTFVKRAAPFPVPPPQAKRTFTVKIEGR